MAFSASFLCPLQKAKATTKDILAEAGKHSFAEQAMFDKVPVWLRLRMYMQ